MMPRATQKKLTAPEMVDNLFLVAPDTDFHDFLIKTEELLDFAPEITERIDANLDARALEKKAARIADARFLEEQTEDFPELILPRLSSDERLVLGQGRRRMPPYLVYLFLMIRGYLNSLTDRDAWTFINESTTLRVWLSVRGYVLPARTTLFENVNAVSNTTRTYIHDCQIRFFQAKEMDDFERLFQDSTSVFANSSWPTDSGILLGLLERVNGLGQKLSKLFGLANFALGRMPSWLEKLDSFDFQIKALCGKANSKKKQKKLYRKLLPVTEKARLHLSLQLEKLTQSMQESSFTLLPSRMCRLEEIVRLIESDLNRVKQVIDYTRLRIVEEKSTPSTEKVLSQSDPDASYIRKGGRQAVIGYKPQLVRSGNGFIVSLIVPRGNAADSGLLVPAIEDAISRTGVIPSQVSVDDGYSSKENRRLLKELGIDIVSMNGATGKKVTPIEEWDSLEYKTARNDRSAIESLMFTIKYRFGFGQLSRRGLKQVTAELLEKVLAYNLCRMVQIEQRRRKEADKLAA